MAKEHKLCLTCREKTPDTSVRGTCQAASHMRATQLPDDHDPWTASPNLTLCNGCADRFKMCAWCWGPLDGHSPVTVPTEKRFTIADANMNGKHITGMHVGEQVLVKLTVDRFSAKTWKIADYSYGVRLAASRMITDGGQWGQYAKLELYFDLDEKDPKAFIELVEGSDHRWFSVPNPQTWKVTIGVDDESEKGVV